MSSRSGRKPSLARQIFCMNPCADSDSSDEEGVELQVVPNVQHKAAADKQDVLNVHDASVLASVTNVAHTLSNRLSRIPIPKMSARGPIPNVVFHLVRHGEALHNILSDLEQAAVLVDPKLTDNGISQCEEFRTRFPATYASQISMILASPSRRALQTSVFCFNKSCFLKRDIQFIAVPDLRELGDEPCNRCTTKYAIWEVTDNMSTPVSIDLTLLRDGTNWGSFDDVPGARSKRMLENLYELQKCILTGGKWMGDIDIPGPAQKDVHVAVVSHGLLLTEMIGLYGNVFKNTDYMSAIFAPRKKFYTIGQVKDELKLIPCNFSADGKVNS